MEMPKLLLNTGCVFVLFDAVTDAAVLSVSFAHCYRCRRQLYPLFYRGGKLINLLLVCVC